MGAGAYGGCGLSRRSVVYTANYNAGTVSVISTSSNSVTNTLTVGNSARCNCVHPNGTAAYVANYKSNSVSAIDTKSVSVVKTIAVGTNPYGIASAPNGGAIYVTNFHCQYHFCDQHGLQMWRSEPSSWQSGGRNRDHIRRFNGLSGEPRQRHCCPPLQQGDISTHLRCLGFQYLNLRALDGP